MSGSALSGTLIVAHSGSTYDRRMVDMGSLVGTIRRFGLVGPSYEVIGVLPANGGREPRMRIKLLESGEETDYALAQLLADPDEN